MTRHRPRTVILAPSAYEAIRAENCQSQLCRPGLETGGILLGHPAGTRPGAVATSTEAVEAAARGLADTAIGDGARHELHVTVAGDPGPHAVHEPLRFLRDSVHAQNLAEQAWSDHGAVWIGEWHTHPAAGLEPSEVDLRSYLHHLADPDLAFEEFLSLIVAGTSEGPALAAWTITSTHLTAARLKLALDRASDDAPDGDPGAADNHDGNEDERTHP